MPKTADVNPVENGRAAPPSREANRSSTSLSNDNYDFLWNEARRRGFPMTITLNLLLEELRELRLLKSRKSKTIATGMPR